MTKKDTKVKEYKRQHWNSNSPLDVVTAQYIELKQMIKPEYMYKEFRELVAYMIERDNLLQQYGDENKIPWDIVKALIDKYKDVFVRYEKVSDECLKERAELMRLIDQKK